MKMWILENEVDIIYPKYQKKIQLWLVSNLSAKKLELAPSKSSQPLKQNGSPFSLQLYVTASLKEIVISEILDKK